jgi:hypothetical protein
MKLTAILQAVLMPTGVVLLFLAAMARIDSHEEQLGIRVTDVFIGFMLAFSFVLAREARPVRRRYTIAGACLIWIFASGCLLSLHEFQIYARTTGARQAFTRHQISQIYEALAKFSRDCRSLPLEGQGLTALARNPGLGEWNGPYVSDATVFDDAWRRPLRYSPRDAQPLVWSSGPDGTSGTKDDVVVTYEEWLRCR